MLLVFTITVGLSMTVFIIPPISLVEADPNDKVRKTIYGHLEDGDCIFEVTPFNPVGYPIGWCPTLTNGHGHTFILNDQINRNSVITTTVIDGECRVREMHENIGVLLECSGSELGHPLNYVVMNP